MPWVEVVGYVLLFAVAGAVAVVAAVHLLWRLDGIRRIRRAGPRLLLATRHRIWREPTLADLSDLRFGPGGAAGRAEPPFQFVEEHFTGSQPCVAVRDARGPTVAGQVGPRSEARGVRRHGSPGRSATSPR